MQMTSMDTGKTVVLASADAALRQRLHRSLEGLRWQVREARGGAEAFAHLEDQPTEALLLDHWLPDLEVGEFAEQVGAMFPAVDLLRVDGDSMSQSRKSPRRHELLHALREALDGDGSGQTDRLEPVRDVHRTSERVRDARSYGNAITSGPARQTSESVQHDARSLHTEGIVGQSAPMLELGRMIHLVAPRKTTVLIEGETGTGKELVAQALHKLSTRSAKPFVVLNCAAIPEALLEAELFGHTRGAFTGAVQSRVGRIEAAHGGTLFLDEIGEMPVALQAKLLRFLENGELQRVGENEMLKVDVRVIAATHQLLEERAEQGSFRLDLYHRLAVFPLEIPALRERSTDIALISEHLLASMGQTSQRKTLSSEALGRLAAYSWPGNVRELAHVLERACILAEDLPCIDAEHVRLRRTVRS